MRIDTDTVLSEMSQICRNSVTDTNVVASFNKLAQLLISAKLGGPKWHELAARVSSKLKDPAQSLASLPTSRSRVGVNPGSAIDCLKTAKWKKPTDPENQLHPSTSDQLYNKFCESSDRNPEDIKSLVLYFTAQTADENHHHILNNSTREFVGQSVAEFDGTVKNILKFARDEKEAQENPNAFVDSYAHLLSSLDFDKDSYQYYAKNHQDIPCFRPVQAKIPKVSKMLTIQDNVTALNTLAPKVNPEKISVRHQQILQTLNDFQQRAVKARKFPSTGEIDTALEESDNLLKTFNDSKFTPAEYKDHLIETYHKCATRISSGFGEPRVIGEKLKALREEKLFSPVEKLSPNISVEDLERKLDELQVRVAKAEAYKKAGFI